MKIRKSLIVISIALFFGLLIIGCRTTDSKDKNISLDFLVTPDQIRIYNRDQLIVLEEIEEKARDMIKSRNEKYDDLSNMSEEDIKVQEEIHNQSMEILNSGKIIDDKDRIENIFNELKSLKGTYIDSFEENITLRIDLIEDMENQSIVDLDNTHLRTLLLLEDGSMEIPKALVADLSKGIKPKGEIEYIKLELPEKLRQEFERS